VATAQFKHHLLLQGYATLQSTINHVFTHQLGTVGEVFSGSLHTWPQESVGHQGFSTAGTVMPLISGLLGLEGNAVNKEVQFAPHFPAHWTDVAVNGFSVGQGSFSFRVLRDRDRLSITVIPENGRDFSVILAPALGVGTEIKSVSVDGTDISYDLITSQQTVQPRLSLTMGDTEKEVIIQFKPTVEILPPLNQSKIGDRNQGIKILSVKKSKKNLNVTCEGLSGKTYPLDCVNAERIETVRGASRDGSRLLVSFPQGNPLIFQSKEITIQLKEE
jgi:hypothetical protein